MGKAQLRTCHFCNTEEGEIRPIGKFKVELDTIQINETKMLACQSCQRKILNNLQSKKLKRGLIMNSKKLFKKILHRLFSVMLLSLLAMSVVQAQGLPGPPVFPGTPSEAPIDGGLSLLAAAGGAYAWKKLRDKNKFDQP